MTTLARVYVTRLVPSRGSVTPLKPSRGSVTPLKPSRGSVTPLVAVAFAVDGWVVRTVTPAHAHRAIRFAGRAVTILHGGGCPFGGLALPGVLAHPRHATRVAALRRRRPQG